MSALSLVLSSFGLVTGVGLDAPSTCAAIRCAIDAFDETRFMDAGGEWIMGCEVPLEQWSIGNETYAAGLDDPDEALGRAYGDPTPIAFDLEWYATTPPTPLEPVGERRRVRQREVDAARRQRVEHALLLDRVADLDGARNILAVNLTTTRKRLPSPTETFVRNYGPGRHHIALAVRDGEANGVVCSVTGPALAGTQGGWLDKGGGEGGCFIRSIIP